IYSRRHASREPSKHRSLQRRKDTVLLTRCVLKTTIHLLLRSTCSCFALTAHCRLLSSFIHHYWQFPSYRAFVGPSLLPHVPHRCPAVSALRDTAPTHPHACQTD